MPEWVRTVMCRYPSGRRHAQIVADEIATAVYAVQMNTVTFHPWPVSATDTPTALDHPDEIRIDLDPQPGSGFREAVEAAYVLREVLHEAGLTGFPKTSGNRGCTSTARSRRSVSSSTSATVSSRSPVRWNAGCPSG